jgi:hypothetical protein
LNILYFARWELLRAILKRPRQAQMRFNPRQVCVGYVVDKMVLGQCGGQNGAGSMWWTKWCWGKLCSQYYSIPPVRIMPPPLHTHSFVCHRHCKMLRINGVLKPTTNSIKTHKLRFSQFIKIKDFWEVRTCRVVNTYRRFEWSHCLRLRGKAVQRMTTQSTLKMKAEVGNCVPMYGMWHFKMLQSTTIRLCELQITQVSL